MNSFFFFLPIIIIIISLLIIFIDTLLKNNSNKKYIILVFNIIISALSIIIFSNNYRDQEEFKKSLNENKKLNADNIELTKNNAILININKAITEDIRNWFTGSNSFPFIEIVNNNKLKLFSNGKFPVRDIYIRIVDYYYYNSNGFETVKLDLFKNYETKIDYLKYNLPQTLPDINFKNYIHNNKFSLIIFFETRNNSFTQTLSGEFDNGKLKITNNSICEDSGHLTNLSKELSISCKPYFIWE